MSAPRYRVKDLLTINESGFLLDATDGESFTLNRTGLAILRALLAGDDARRIGEKIAETFDVPEATARRDVDRFLAHLGSLGLVAQDPTAGG